MHSDIFIPKKIKVGFQNRDDTYTNKLAYVIYYDEKGKLRKQASWESWRDKKSTFKTIDGMSVDDIMIDGYNITEWYSDLLLRYQIIKYDNEMKELKALENKLSKMLSSDKKSRT